MCSFKVEYVSSGIGWMCSTHNNRQQFLEKALPVSQNTLPGYFNEWDLSTHTDTCQPSLTYLLIKV